MTREDFIRREANERREIFVSAARKIYQAPILTKGPLLSVIAADTAPVSGAVPT